MEKFKNAALSRENGIIVSHCIQCGERIGDEYTMNFYALIRQKYCTKCSAEREKIGLAFRKGEYKKRKKKTMKEYRSLMDIYVKEIQVQKEYIAMLENKIDDLERSNQR